MKILIVDDSRTILKLLKDTLLSRGHEVTIAEDGLEGVTQYEKEKPDIMFIDIVMPGTLGDEVALQILEANPTQKLILMTGDKAKKDEINKRFPNIPLLLKPFNTKEILDCVTPEIHR